MGINDQESHWKIPLNGLKSVQWIPFLASLSFLNVLHTSSLPILYRSKTLDQNYDNIEIRSWSVMNRTVTQLKTETGASQLKPSVMIRFGIILIIYPFKPLFLFLSTLPSHISEFGRTKARLFRRPSYTSASSACQFSIPNYSNR